MQTIVTWHISFNKLYININYTHQKDKIAMINKRHTTPVLRLAMRLMRQRGHSYPQIIGATGFSMGGVYPTCRNISADNLRQITLGELGLSETADSNLYDNLLAEASAWLGQRLERLQAEPPRGCPNSRRAA